MKKRSFVFTLAVILALLIVSAASVSAQDVNLDNMDNEQLMLLLQSIMNKLDQEETAVPGQEPVPTETPDVPAAEPASVSEVKSAKTHHIYEVKKLSIERIPDDRFIPKPKEGGGGGEEEKEKEGGEDKPYCEPPATYECYTDRYGWRHCGCGVG